MVLEGNVRIKETPLILSYICPCGSAMKGMPTSASPWKCAGTHNFRVTDPGFTVKAVAINGCPEFGFHPHDELIWPFDPLNAASPIRGRLDA